MEIPPMVHAAKCNISILLFRKKKSAYDFKMPQMMMHYVLSSLFL